MSEATIQDGKEPPRRISRRQVLSCAGCAGLGFAAGWGAGKQAWRSIPAETRPESAQQALQRLREGNQRFVEGRIRHADQSRTWRHALVADQHPFAIVLGCSDSRVPIELLFDQGFGDLFVIRVAGNVISPDVIGSIGYAVAHLHTRLLMVLGHEGCGAVTAALQSQVGASAESANIEALLRLVSPGLRDLPPQLDGAARLSAAVEANVRWSMQQVLDTPEAQARQAEGVLKLVGAVYELTTGRVRFLP
jgi:carbonic anhydrase